MIRRIFLFLPVLLSLAACGGSFDSQSALSTQNDVISAINAARDEENLQPLQIDQTLSRTAQELARRSITGAVSKDGENRLPVVTKAGAFARFALYHLGQSDSTDGIIRELAETPEARAKILQGNLTHVGIGIETNGTSLFAALDLARLVPTVPEETARKKLEENIQATRKRNSVEPIEFEDKLNVQAQNIADSFMNGTGTSEDLITQAQQTLSGNTFAIGRVTITFQVVGTINAMVIPSITSDPRVAFAGLGIAQGNNPDHEPGSQAIALLLAESQTAHEVERYDTNIPTPKSAPSSKSKKGSAVDRAWIATLAGNHRKAAAAFTEAHRKKGTPVLLYEAARAHARDGNTDAALSSMKKYANLVEGDEKDMALAKVALLEQGKTIFSTSETQKMSVEAQRFFAMGQRLFEQEEWEGAIDAFQQAYAYTKHPDIIYNIGLVHSRAGRIGESLHFFGEYQKAVPEAGNVDEAKQLFEIGVELFKAGQFETASKNFAMSYAYIPFPHLIYNLALCHKEMGQNDVATRFLREYLDTDPPKKERKQVEEIIKKLAQGESADQ